MALSMLSADPMLLRRKLCIGALCNDRPRIAILSFDWTGPIDKEDDDGAFGMVLWTLFAVPMILQRDLCVGALTIGALLPNARPRVDFLSLSSSFFNFSFLSSTAFLDRSASEDELMVCNNTNLLIVMMECHAMFSKER